MLDADANEVVSFQSEWTLGISPAPESFTIQLHFNSFYLESKALKCVKINAGLKNKHFQQNDLNSVIN